jgi:GH35 family endo-1,4-beta-xylanase
LALGLGVAMAALVAQAAVPESYRKMWSDPAVVRRINDGIEKNRKQDATLELRTAEGKPLTGAKVEVEQTGHEFLFGCNAFVLGQLDTPEMNRKYEETFVRLFNFATVPFYWEGTEPTQGELRYAEGARDIWRRPPADRFIAFARKYGLTLKGHPLLWHAYNPPWLPGDAETLKRLYQKRFAEIGSRYAKDIQIWDVVNESLACSEKYPLYTPDLAYVGWAFKEAHRHFGAENTLMINETTGHSHRPPQKNLYYRQVQDLLKQGVRVQGIGFQFHFFSAAALAKSQSDPTYAPAALLDVYDKFADLKLPLYLTEITIPTPADSGEAVQAEVVGNLYRLWFSAAGMAGITWWNLGDGTAVKGENSAKGGLVDANLDPKASYRVLDRLINHEWKTRISTTTDARGQIRFRGFCGKYSVSVDGPQGKQPFEIELAKDQPVSQKLTLRP